VIGVGFLGALGGEFLNAAGNPELEILIGRIAQEQADSGWEALSEYLSDAEVAAAQASPGLQAAYAGKAVQQATYQTLLEMFGEGSWRSFANAPYDLVFTRTGEVFELTTVREAASHAARGATLVVYYLML